MSRIRSSADRPGLWWTLLGVATLAVLAAVPLTLPLQKILRQSLGAHGLRLALVAAVLMLALLALDVLRRRGALQRRRLLETLAVLVVLAAWISRLPVVAEGVHLILYGLLAALALRTLACHRQDRGAYLAALAYAAAIGAIEEFLQWLAPGRYWDLHDIGLNLAGAACGLLLTWSVFRPARLSPPPRPGTLGLAFVLALVGVVAGALPWLLGPDAT